ncbi:hypothetical protein BDZ97DRAFT_184118 [Flammula alnicola]|nr:hypothetical protein BDZ97DRAFT_184118 [Flammula alnicola]
MPIGAYYPKRDVTTDPNVPRGMSHYPQHIIAQAEAQKAQKLAAQQQNQQQQAAAGPSGSGSGASSTTPQHANSSSQTAQHGPAQIMLSLGGTTEGLNIQEYQPPQNQGQPQSLSQGPEKRTTRSSGNTTVSAPPASTTARHTRAASKGNQQQQQAPAPVNGTGSTSLNADGTMPTTFAGIMNAYPAPGIAAPMPGQATTSTS